MHLTQQTDYALRVLIYAAINDDGLVNIAEIAKVYNISKSHLMKVVTALVKGGFLYSIRGKGGGLRLGKPTAEINVGEVVRLMEPLTIVECFGDRTECLISPHCRLAGILNSGLKVFFTWVIMASPRDILLANPTLAWDANCAPALLVMMRTTLRKSAFCPLLSVKRA